MSKLHARGETLDKSIAVHVQALIGKGKYRES